MRTAGGHRRILFRDVRKRLAVLRSPAEQRRLTAWLEGLLSGHSAKVADLLKRSRLRSEGWAGVADEVSHVIVELGDIWQAGDCSVFDEHLATEALRRGAAACADALPRRRGSRRALLTTAPGERHTLGLSLAELVLAERGWRSLWIGEGPPVREFPAMLTRLAPDLCVVAASASIEPKTLRTLQRSLVRAFSSHGGRLVLAGQGRWSPATSVHRCRTFEEFDRLLRLLSSRRGEDDASRNR
jgi:methanogenic corrinoid protein MtbC1